MKYEEKKLSELVDTISDTRKIDKDEVVLVNTSDVLAGEVLNHTYTENCNLRGQFKKRFKPDDILYSEIRPANKRFAYVDFDSEDYIASTKLMVLRRKSDKITNRYLYYCLTNDLFVEKMQHLAEARSGTFPQITFDVLKGESIYLPSIDEQNKITSILDNINNKIRLNNEINNNLHDLAEQQFNEIYSLGSPKKLDELLFNVSTGSRPKGGAQESGIPSIGAEKIEKFGIYDYSSEKYISEDYYEKLKNGKLNSGDVLLYKDGAYTGKVSMCLNGFPHNKAAVNEHVFILNTENNWAQNYLYFVLYNKDNKEMLHRLASSKAAQPGLNQVELKSIEINICDKDDILKFENSVKPLMEKIALNSLENKRLSELRDTLLPKLMNGEINLDNIEI